MKTLLIILVLVFMPVTLFAQEQEPADAPEKQEENKNTSPAANLTPEEIAENIGKLNSRYFFERQNANTTIRKAGEAAIPLLRKLLDEENIALKIAAICLLGSVKDTESVAHIVRMQNHGSQLMRMSARQALVNFGPGILEEIDKLVASGKLKGTSVPDSVFAEAYRERLVKMISKNKLDPSDESKPYEEIKKLGKAAIPGLMALLEESMKGSKRAPVQPQDVLNALSLFDDDKRVKNQLLALYVSHAGQRYKRDIAVALARLGEDSCIEEWVESQTRNGASESTYGSIGHLFHGLKDYKNAEKWWSKAAEAAKDQNSSYNVHLYNTACAQSLGGKHDEAAKTLEKAIESGYRDFSWMSKDSDFDPIRKHPGYLKIAKKYCPELLPKEKKAENKDGEALPEDADK